MNLTGPLIHPMALETQLLGISRPELLESTAQVLKKYGSQTCHRGLLDQKGLMKLVLNGATKHCPS